MAATNMLELLDGNTLLEATIDELRRQLTPEEIKYETRNTVNRLKLVDMVEATAKITCEQWQRHMCKRLEKLTWQKGQRLLLHGPPQHGKSIIVSQRLPTYLIGDNPASRIKIACHNIEQATKHTRINKAIMQGGEYQSMFPNKDTRVPTKCSDEQFSTMARRSFRDGQPSLKALGLQTGFVGEGADHLIIDDPYASQGEAKSEAVAKKIWGFWVEDSKVRIDEDTNVVIMFHRYHEDDFIGQLIQEEGLQSQGGIWELICYRAEWDGDERLEIGGKDPIKRKVGEYLSPRKSRQPGYYKEQKRNPSVWQALFQGKPSRADGNFFLVNKLRVIPRIPIGVNIIKLCRAWDLASSDDGDWTVGVLMGLGDNGYVYVLDVVRCRKTTDERNRLIRYTAREDKRRYTRLAPDGVKIRMPQDPNSAGKDVALSMRKLLIGFDLTIETVSGKGDKEMRADPWSQYVNSGLVRLVYNGDLYAKDDNGDYVSWVPDFVEEHRRFPGGATTKKDQVDASSDCYSEIALEIDNPPGESFDTLGLYTEWEAEERRELGLETEEDLMNDMLGISEEENYANDSEYTPAISGSSQRLKPVNTYSTRRARQDAKKASPRRFRLKRSDCDR